MRVGKTFDHQYKKLKYIHLQFIFTNRSSKYSFSQVCLPIHISFLSPYIYIYTSIYAIMKTMYPPGYHHYGFVATHAPGHMMYRGA